MHTPINKLIVSLEKKLYDSRTFESGQTIYFDPSWQPEEYAMLKAKVVSVPPGVIKRQDYKGYSICVEPGDEILIRYDVVFAYNDQPDRDTPIYKNLIFNYNEQLEKFEELWLCDILQVFAIIKDGQYHMINGFVMMEPVVEKRADFSSKIIRPDSFNNVLIKDRAIVRAINSRDLPISVGDTIFINPNMVMQYQLNLEKFFIIKEQYILGIQG
jgi:co-chaperonin GroES (HSP10)